MDKRVMRQLIGAMEGEEAGGGQKFESLLERVEAKAEEKTERLRRELEQHETLLAVVDEVKGQQAHGGLTPATSLRFKEYLSSWVDGAPAAVHRSDFVLIDKADNPPVEETHVAVPALEPEDTSSSDAGLIENDPELLEIFAVEATEHLEAIEALILDGSVSVENKETIDALFRAFHTVKGNSSFFGLTNIQNLAHEMETILDQVRNNELQFTDRLQELVLTVQSALLQMVQTSIAEGTNSEVPGPARQALSAFQEKPAEASPEEGQGGAVVPREEPPTKGPAEPTASTKASVTNDFIRVEANRLDFLVDLIGELVISYSIVSDSINTLGATSSRLQQGVKQLTAIIRDLQSLSTSLRMVPIKPVFQRMKRLVRDVATTTGKNVNFVVSGEETQVDKTLVDEVGDPLVHLLRNAIDHGLETSEDRAKSGKDVQGSVRLSAAQRGSWIIVEIEDDGKGLDTERIRAKAIDRGLIDEGSLLPDERIHELIMHPGFSTAQSVSEVSGRGVGMDVVKKSVEALRGSLDIRSVSGVGTTFTLRFPLTLAIIDGVVARIGSEHYIVPASTVVQTVRHSGHPVSTIGGEDEVVVYREEAIPLVRLSDLFQVPDATEPNEETLLMVLDCDSKRFALMVDQLVGKQHVVIKSLDALLKKAYGIAGSAIMPDGSVGLIVDVETIAKDLQLQIDSMVAA